MFPVALRLAIDTIGAHWGVTLDLGVADDRREEYEYRSSRWLVRPGAVGTAQTWYARSPAQVSDAHDGDRNWSCRVRFTRARHTFGPVLRDVTLEHGVLP